MVSRTMRRYFSFLFAVSMLVLLFILAVSPALYLGYRDHTLYRKTILSTLANAMPRAH
jgi:hypothetical protein